MKRTDSVNVKSCRFFKNILHLSTVFSDNTYIVASCLVRPRLLDVQSAEFAERISREQHLFGTVIGQHDLRPMHHRSSCKGKCVLAEGKRVSFSNNHTCLLKISSEKVFHHLKSLSRSDDFGLRVGFCKIHNISRMVRLHMLNYKIIGISVSQRILEIIQPFVGKVNINSVQNGDFLVNNHIGIVRHSVGNRILTFKQVNSVVIDADILYIMCNIHNIHLC